MARRAEIPALTGLRGIAALLVVITHYFATAAPYQLATAPTWLRPAFDHGELAMHLFFALSGFVIAYNYCGLEWRQAPGGSLRRFAWLRFSRLYPAYALFIIVALIRNTPNAPWWTALHVAGLQSWVPAKLAGALPGDGAFNLSWSISTEAALYLLFAGTMIAIGRWGVAALVGCFAGLAAIAALPDLSQSWAALLPSLGEPLTYAEARRWLYYLSPIYRVPEFSIGAMFAIAVLRWPGALQWPVLRLPQSLLSWRPLLLVGEVSYSLYLFHMFVPHVSFGLGVRPFALGLLPLHVANIALRTLLAIVVAAGLYWMVERPAQRWLRARAWRREGVSVVGTPASAPAPAPRSGA